MYILSGCHYLPVFFLGSIKAALVLEFSISSSKYNYRRLYMAGQNDNICICHGNPLADTFCKHMTTVCNSRKCCPNNLPTVTFFSIPSQQDFVVPFGEVLPGPKYNLLDKWHALYVASGQLALVK